MIALSSALAPSIDRVGLQVNIGPAALWFSGAAVFLQPATVFLSANNTFYIYLNSGTNTVQTNTTGFTSTVIPIATVVTGLATVTSLVDNRPDFYGNPFASISYADNETPTGTINGINTVFTLAFSPSPSGSLQLFLNGVFQRPGGTDYTLSGNTITFLNPPQGALGNDAADTLNAFYRH